MAADATRNGDEDGAVAARPFSLLAGVHVLDLTSSLAGPYCTQILAALGADVVKVEHPARGDESRAWGTPFHGEASALFFAANAGKRSLALDLKAARGRDVLLRLVDGADVFVQSLRPGTADRLGLDPESLRARNERLVYCSIGSFGRVGPLSPRPAYDPLVQAAAGLISLTGEPDRPGVRVGTSIVDEGTGVWAALGVVTALWERERSGRGRTVDVSLYETALALIPYQLAEVAAGAPPPARQGTAFSSIVPYQVFATSDGALMIAAANDRLFASLCEVLGLPGLPRDERFATNPARVEHRNALVRLIARRLAEDPTSTWLERLNEAGVPAAPVRDVSDVVRDDQTRALEILQPLDGRITVALPFSVDATRPRHRSPPPRLGEHTADVLAEAGYEAGEIDALVRGRVVRVADEP